MIFPMAVSLFADMLATAAMPPEIFATGRDIDSISATTLATPLCMPRTRALASTPDATRRRPDLKIASARMVAVVVPSPALSDVFDAASLTSCAPMFSTLFRSSISSATVTPSLVTVGPPQDLSSTAFRPRGPSVDLTAAASFSTPASSDFRASVSKTISFTAIDRSPQRSLSFEVRHYEPVITVDRPLGRGSPSSCLTTSKPAPKTNRSYNAVSY